MKSMTNSLGWQNKLFFLCRKYSIIKLISAFLLSFGSVFILVSLFHSGDSASALDASLFTNNLWESLITSSLLATLITSIYIILHNTQITHIRNVALRDKEVELASHEIALNQHAIFTVTDAEGRFTYVNQKFCDACGYSKEELLGKHINMMAPPEQEELLNNRIMEIISKGRTWQGDLKNITKDGSIYWLQSTIVPFKDVEGEIFKYIAIQNDITEFKLSEESRNEEVGRFSKYTETSTDWYWETDKDMRFSFISARISEIIGNSPSDLIGRKRDEVSAVRIDPEILKQNKEDVKARRPYTDFEYGVEKPDGTIAFLRINGAPLFGDNGEFLGYCGTGTDITKLKQAEDAGKQEAVFRQKLLETMNQGYWHLSKEGITLDINPAMCAILDRSYKEIIGKSVYDFLDDKNTKLVKYKLNYAENIIKAENYEVELKRPDGSNVPCLINRTPIFNESGKLMSFVGMFTNISQTKEISEKLNSALSETVIANNDLKYEAATNIAIANLFRYTTTASSEGGVLNIALNLLKELKFLMMSGVGSGYTVDPSNQHVIPVTGDELGENWRAPTTGEIEYTACSEKHPDIEFNGDKPHGHYIVPIKIDDIVACILVLHVKHGIEYGLEQLDFLKMVAEIVAGAIKRIRTEKKTIQAERFASLGTMVAGIAHEINTPVGTAVTNVSELKDKTLAFEKQVMDGGIKKSDLDRFILDAKDFSGMALNNLLRAAELVRSFKQVSVDESSEEKRQFNMLDHINAIITTMNHEFKRTNISINVDCADNVVIDSHPGAWSQVITNLCHNSLIHGFDEGKTAGDINIKIRWASDADWLVLTYSDTGTGIPSSKQEKVFDPFFTTRHDKGGSGLGMHIVQNLVTQTLNGSIEILDTSEQGVFFLISVPTNPNSLERNK